MNSIAIRRGMRHSPRSRVAEWPIGRAGNMQRTDTDDEYQHLVEMGTGALPLSQGFVIFFNWLI